jgi:hypothetical protein
MGGMYRFLTSVLLAVAAVMLAGTLVFVAAGFLIGALYLALLAYMSAPLAALATAGAALIGALLVLALGSLLWPRLGRGLRQGLKAEGLGGNALAAELGKSAGAFFGTHKTGSVAAALLAGFAVGLSPRLRQSLIEMLKTLLR